MKITIVQPETIWEDKAANLRNIEKEIQKHIGKSDLIVLPEMFTTGFTLNAESYSEESDGDTFRWMTLQAQNGKMAICGSFILKSGGKFYNHFCFVTAGNENFSYDKRHLFGLGGEHEIYTRGKTRRVFSFKELSYIPVICYDLRFPVWCRNRRDYDVMICVASWPDVRRDAWNSLLKARAIENQCYVIGVNNSGTDKNGFRYAGDSVIIDPLGTILCKVNEYEQGSETADISLQDLTKFRQKFPFWRDADEFTIIENN